MYLDMLAPNSNEFEAGINRSFPQHRTRRLDSVVAALTMAQGRPVGVNLRALLDRMHEWRNGEPNEFRNRGGTNGVAYRLWMEAKQALRNNFGQVHGQPVPAAPPACPGSAIGGVYVPPGEGNAEICHGFAYRWAIAAGKLRETVSAARGMAYNGGNMLPVLYPGGGAAYPAARAGGVLQIQAGDIIGMFNGMALGHSLIAEGPNLWFSANNAGTFGMGVGRQRVDVNAAFPVIGMIHTGWVGAGSQWMRPDGVALTVVYRRIP